MLSVATALTACASGASTRGLPPFWEHETELPGGLAEERAAFGLVSRTRGPDGAMLSAIRPLVAKVEDGRGAEKVHVVPPIGSHSENAKGEKTTVWPLFFDEVFGTEEEERRGESDDDTWIFPLLAWGHEPREGSYFGFFPFGGTLKGKFAADRLDFVAFPAYVHTESDPWRSTHVLWPLIAWGDSPTRHHFRVLPFWSETDSPTRRSRTLLWPFIHWSVEKRGERTFDSWFVFPLAGRRTSRDGQYLEWTTLWPFFEFAHDEKSGDSYTGAPWPFYKRHVRPGISESTWYWPLYGTYESKDERSSFYAWPIVWDFDEVRGRREFRHFYVVPFWMERSAGPAGAAPDDEELRSWPFFSWRRRGDGTETVRVPEIVPFFGWEPGETLYADLLSIVRWRGDADGRVAWDAPLSVVRYRRGADGAATLTLLWWIDIPLGGAR